MSHSRRVVRAEQIKALASPVRHEIADCLAAGGPMSVAELAGELERTPQSLYFHVQGLLDVGLIKVAGERVLPRHVETLYIASRELRLRYDHHDPDCRDALSAMAASIHRVSTRDFKRGLESASAQTSGKHRNLWAARILAWVSPEELAQVNALLNSLVDLLSTRWDSTKTERVALQWTLAPMPARHVEKERSARSSNVQDTPRKEKPIHVVKELEGQS